MRRRQGRCRTPTKPALYTRDAEWYRRGMNKRWEMGLRLAFGTLMTALVVGGTAGIASAQGASDPYVAPSPTVESSSELRPESQVASASIELNPSPDVEGSNLAFTGSDVTSIAAVGFAALVVGGFVLFVRRRSASA